MVQVGLLAAELGRQVQEEEVEAGLPVEEVELEVVHREEGTLELQVLADLPVKEEVGQRVQEAVEVVEAVLVL